SDLASYRSGQKLSACTVASGCLTIVNQTGATSPLPPAPPKNDDWTTETALDIDMASAVCPNCKILLVQADDDQGDGLYIGQQTAASLGASVISNSWGGPDPDGSGTTEGEPYFQVNPAINIFVATGDNGWDNLIGSTTKAPGGPDFPSTSLYVIGVGGTNVTLTSAGLRSSETAWSDGGSSCSVINPKPAYQTSVVSAAACGFRAASDVAAIGGTPGVVIYHSGSTAEEGTSVASPLVASIFALYGMSKSDPGFPYAHTTAFTDITSGNNAATSTTQSQFNCTTTGTNKQMCTAGTGWDGPTGMGAPIGSAFATITAEPTPPAGADMATGTTSNDLAAPEGSDMSSTGSTDLAQPEGDLAHAEHDDLGQPGADDLGVGTGGGGQAGGGGSAGGTGQAGGGGSGGGNNGCGCTLGGANGGSAGLALPLMLALFGFMIIRRRRA
ncbi:MAG TPA: hypothetical protein VIA18_32760, partial [Polyangia bacterium]|nr:hypothetical protein [Polyangia bacterium]